MALKVNMSIYLALLSSLLCLLNTSSADEAIPLITVKKNQGNGEAKFVLNQEAISMIKQLSSPVKVIAAIGDARVGKSTALNFIHYTLNNLGNSVSETKNAERIFETGNTMKAVTHGVWIAKPTGKHGMDNVILLDVEGTDLGDDAVTDKLSILTALTSSTLMLFMKQFPSTHILDFLYKIVRLSEAAFGEKESENFPRLTVVVLGALEPPEEYRNIEDYIIDALITSKWKDESDKKRDDIGTRFPKEHIKVFNLPYDPKLLKKTMAKRIAGSEYLESIEKLTEHILQSPEKKSLKGVVLDGQYLAELAEKLVKVMNNKTLWDDLNPDFYALFEEQLCRKSYEKHIEPLILDITKLTVQEINAKKDEKMTLFKERCKSTKWIIEAQSNIKNAIKSRENYEKEDYIWDTAIWIGKWVLYSVACAMALRFVSDVQLKENISVLNNSEYETIGLRGVEWVWNQEAERLWLSGKGSGVVAQEVELLYPWAVTEGYDGYKRVNYLALRLLIWAKKFQRKAEDLINI